jgi:general secretion pathway protein N
MSPVPPQATLARPRSGRSRGRGWAWALGGGALGLMVGVVMFAPAQWLAEGLEASGTPLRLHNSEGTFWSGSGQLLLGSMALPGRVQWDLQPDWRDGNIALSARLRASCCLLQDWTWQLTAEDGALKLRVEDLPSNKPLRVSAALLSGFGAPWNTLKPQGQLALVTEGLSIKAGARSTEMQGTLQLDALSLSTSLSTLTPVGSYRLRFQSSQSGETPSNTLTLSTLEGALLLRGEGSMQAGRLVFQGEAGAAEGREDALSNLLNIIGQRQGARSMIRIG